MFVIILIPPVVVNLISRLTAACFGSDYQYGNHRAAYYKTPVFID